MSLPDVLILLRISPGKSQSDTVLLSIRSENQLSSYLRIMGFITASRAPLLLLLDFNCQADTSLAHHDSQAYLLPATAPIQSPDFSLPASSWMKPLATSPALTSLVEIPGNWYGEDMTPLQYLPHTSNSHGYVDVRLIEQIWKDRFSWLWENGETKGEGSEKAIDFIFPLILHPDTSGMGHVIGMIERFIRWLQGWGSEVQFWRYEDIAAEVRREANIS